MGLAIAAIAATPAAIRAQGIPPVVWNPGGSFSYDNGLAPSVAVSGVVIVEVHEGASGALWYHTGKIQENGTVAWAASPAQYDNGYAPSVAITGNTVIEVHQAAATGVSALWYHTGKIAGNGTVAWASSPFKYENSGIAPSVAVCGQTVIEVHQAGTTAGPLWYHSAEIQTNGTVKWASSAHQYDNGIQPSVAVAGSTVLEVHAADVGSGPLWFHPAEIQADGTVEWASSPTQYDSGSAPSVGASGPTVIEVHQGSSGQLWYHVVALQSDGNATFSGSGKYDNGYAPRVAVAGPTILEVHQADTGTGPLWYHTAAY